MAVTNTISTTELKKQIIAEAKAGDMLLYNKLGSKLGITAKDLGHNEAIYAIRVVNNFDDAGLVELNKVMANDIARYLKDSVVDYLYDYGFYEDENGMPMNEGQIIHNVLIEEVIL